MSDPILVDQVYIHYENRFKYLVMDIALNPNTLEQIVVYREWGVPRPVRAENRYWRPLAEFQEKFRWKHT